MARKKAKPLSGTQIVQMAKEWDTKSITEFAIEFDISPTTVSKAANGLHKQSDGDFCKPKKSAKATIMEALTILRKEEEKDVISQ